MTQTTFKTFEEMEKHFEALLSNNHGETGEIVDEVAEIDKQLEEQNKKKEEAENSINRKQYEQATAKIWELEQRKRQLNGSKEEKSQPLINREEFDALTDAVLDIYQTEESKLAKKAYDHFEKIAKTVDGIRDIEKKKSDLLNTIDIDLGRNAPEFYQAPGGGTRYTQGLADAYKYNKSLTMTVYDEVIKLPKVKELKDRMIEEG